MKNTIIKTILAIASIVWIISLIMVDNASIIPYVVFMLATAVLAYIGWCNDWFEVTR